MNILNYTLNHEIFGSTNLKSFKQRIAASEIRNSEHFTSRLPHILKEKEYDLKTSNINKIFTAQWLDERKCIMGTKCNKLVVLDTVTGKYSIQSPLKSHPNSKNIQNHCGIHSISINPSGTYLATGAEHVNDIAVYSLPSLEPVLVGFNAHKYWIFDIVWLDDDHVVTGAGDNRLALWTVNNSKNFTNLKSNRINSSSSLNKSDNSDSCSNSKILNYMDMDGRVDRQNLKRSSPASPPISSRIPVRLNPFQSFSSPSSSFHNFFNLSRTTAPRFSFYNIENYIPRRGVNFVHDRERHNDDIFDVNDNITEDEDEDQSERANFDDLFRYSNGSNLENEEIDEEEDETDDEFIYNSSSSFLDLFDNGLGQSEVEEDELEAEFNDDERTEMKRRRLSLLGNYKHSMPRMKYKTPTKVIKCKQSKRIRALAFNPKRNEIAAISMNSAFHYFDINRFEQVIFKV